MNQNKLPSISELTSQTAPNPENANQLAPISPIKAQPPPISQMTAQITAQYPPVFSTASPRLSEQSKRKIESPVKKINFPAAKIKAIMKADHDVAMISADAVLAMAAASELFLQELAQASWSFTSSESRKTIVYKDVGKVWVYDYLAKAVDSSFSFEFLKDVRINIIKIGCSKADFSKASYSLNLYILCYSFCSLIVFR